MFWLASVFAGLLWLSTDKAFEASSEGLADKIDASDMVASCPTILEVTSADTPVVAAAVAGDKARGPSASLPGEVAVMVPERPDKLWVSAVGDVSVMSCDPVRSLDPSLVLANASPAVPAAGPCAIVLLSSGTLMDTRKATAVLSESGIFAADAALSICISLVSVACAVVCGCDCIRLWTEAMVDNPVPAV